MGVDEANLLLLVMGVEQYTLTSSSHGVEIKIDLRKREKQFV